ncbi:DUF493 domain-containing protein [Halopseudomonas pachastrellae]|nr:DUF493 domain-containing protein [Pseudomonadota bacterium]WVM89445.1 DUF493 domain-containing protein [Halopseudomonas pachastrellae]WVM94023.1 DUF493 domain-containing protein [Halopseudomonas pachastrellae]HIQ54650.1 DUF493 domain-containing protein [Halopseudomonas pachastrellae]|tara:strand:- start:323 stop:601 length:279 start_codon:yes stop_codon:yes gene_type:complete
MADVNEPQAPKIEFPCQYPIKVIGTAGDDFAEVICEVVERHAPGVDTTTIDVKDSKNGRFLSLRLVITATGQEQLEALHRDLKATGRVHMVL